MRFIQAAPAVASSMCHSLPRDLCNAAYRAEVKSYCELDHLERADSVRSIDRHYTAASESSMKPERHGYAKAAHEFFEVFNDISYSNMGHRCVDSKCCNGFDATVTKQRATVAIIRFLLRVQPLVPNVGEWTNSGPCLDVLLPLFWCGSIVKQLMRIAFQTGSKQLAKIEISKAQDKLVDFCDDIDWQVVAGARLRRTLEFLLDDCTAVRLTEIALIKEPIRWLTCHFLRCARSDRLALKIPRLMDQVNAQHDHAIAACQYLSQLLQGTGSRLTLLLGTLQATRLDQWLASDSSAAFQFHVMIITALSWIYRRHVRYAGAWPWKLALVADPRLSEAKRLAAAEHFFAQPVCCLDPYFSRRLRRRVNTPADLLQPCWQEFLLRWAGQVVCTSAPVEFVHARNKQAAARDMAWPTFSSLFVHAEAKYMQETRLRIKARLESIAALQGSAVTDSKANVYPGRLQGTSALLLFRSELLAATASQGLNVNPVTAHAWADVKQRFAELPAELQDSYHRRAAMATKQASIVRGLDKAPQGQSKAKAHKKPKLAVVGHSTRMVAAAEIKKCSQSDTHPLQFVDARGTCGSIELAASHALGTQAIAEFLHPPGAPHVSLCSCITEFEKQHDGAAEGKAAFPKKVRYPSQCGPLCQSFAAAHVWAVFGQLLVTLRQVAQQFGIGLKTHAAEYIVLAFESQSQQGEVLWAGMPTGLARHGKNPATQNMVRYLPVASLGQVGKALGIRLRLAQQSAVQPAFEVRCPFDAAAAHGCVAVFTEQEWAAFVAQHFQGVAAGKINVSKVAVSLDSMSPHTIVTLGLDSRFDTVQLPTAEVESSKPDGANNAESDVDWLKAPMPLRPRGQYSRNMGQDDEQVQSNHSESEDSNDDLEKGLEQLMEAQEECLQPPPEIAAVLEQAEEEAKAACADGGDAEDSSECEAAEDKADGLPDVPVPQQLPQALARIPLQDALLGSWGSEFEDTSTLTRALGVEILPNWTIRLIRHDDADGPAAGDVLVGKINCIGGKSLKCICKTHKDCALMLNCEGTHAEIERVLLRWACAGAAGASREVHQKDAQAMRLRFGKKKHAQGGPAQA